MLRWLAIPAIGVAGLLALRAVGPAVPLHPLGSYVFSFSCVCALVLASAQACPARARGDLVWLVGALGVLGLVAWSGGRGAAHAAVVLAALLIAGSVLGSVVGTAIEHAGHLVFVALVSSLADAASVLHPKGLSAAIVESEQALSLLALPFALLGTADTPPLLGVGDVVFTALYVAAARRHGLSERRTLLALALAYAVTMVAVAGLEMALPALPFLGLAMVVAHPEARRPAVRDRARGFAAIAVLAMVLVGLALAGR